jgi:hypothetical protein
MYERNLLAGIVGPTTQTIESGKALAKFLRLSEELPESIALANGARLTLSSKKDVYYYTTLQSCTCEAGQNHKICRHRRDLCEAAREAQKAAEPRGRTLAETLEEHDRNLYKMPASYGRMVRMAREEAASEPLELISRGGFKPCLPEEAA